MAEFWPDANKTARVTIVTVDPRTRQVHAVLKDGVAVVLAVWDTPSFFRWPREGEEWTAVYESGYWRLGQHMGDDTTILDLLPGEARIDADNLFISGDTYVLGQAIVLDNDIRLADPRTPLGPAGGVLSGTYPNPGFAVDMATQAELDAVSVLVEDTEGSITAHIQQTTAAHGGIVASTDPRLADARVPMGDAGGVLDGTYPNPSFAVPMATASDLAASNATLATHTALTTPAHGGIVASTDPRLTDSRTPSGVAGGVLAGTYPDPTLATGLDISLDSLDVATRITLGTGPGVVLDQTGYVEAVQSVAANTAIMSRLETDLHARWRGRGDGQLEWGDGASSPDTFLYRANPGGSGIGLVTNKLFYPTQGVEIADGDSGVYVYPSGRIECYPSAATDPVLMTSPTFGGTWPDTLPRLQILANGTIQFGSGTAIDTVLYRSAASVLKTDGNLHVAGWIGAGINPGVPLHVMGSTQIVDVGQIGDTSGYSLFGVTRAATAADLCYIAMTKAATIVKGIGINAAGEMILGSVSAGTGNAGIISPMLRIGGSTVSTDGKLLASGGVGVGNSAAATTLGTLSKKMEVFDASGNSLGFVPIYTTIT